MTGIDLQDEIEAKMAKNARASISACQGITLTDHLLELANGLQAKVLPREVDARWNLVQMSWGDDVTPRD